MSIRDFALDELDRIGLGNDDRTGEDMDYQMRDHILRMVDEFDNEGHSGFSAGYALAILKKLLAFKPLTPLTGEDDEWQHVYDDDDGPVYQNTRLSSVFKNTSRGAYDIDGKVFWEWFTDENGETSKIYFSASGSETPVEFPYTPPDEPIYEYREPEPEDEHEVAYDPNNQPTAEVKAVK
jgi:hypothetical protein